MNAKVYRIPIENDVRAVERIEKLQRTADRLGIAFPTVSIGEPYKTSFLDKLTGQTKTHWWRDITLEGEGIDRPVSYGGWKIIGQFNHEYPKVIINKLSDDIKPEYIDRFEDSNVSFCQHCNKTLRRNNTYVIQNEESGEQMLIGSSCMHHYVPNQNSIDSVMNYYKSFSEIFGNEDDEEGLGFRGESRFTDTHTYLRACFQVLLAGVDIKSEFFGEVLHHLLSGTQPKNKESDVSYFLKRAREAQEDAESEMFHMKLFIGALSENNEFNIRLKRMCEPGYHLIKDCNTVKWGAVKYYDYIHRPRKARSAPSRWVGEKGQMLEIPVAYEERKFLYSSEYGDSYLYVFKTKDGCIITWKTSYIDEEFLSGDMIIRGRVIDLTEYNGIKQTQVTRAKLRKV